VANYAISATMTPNQMANWLKRAIDETDVTQTELARRTGLTPGKVSLIISGKRQLKDGEAFKVSEALNYPLPNENRIIPVMGYVGAGAEVIPVSGNDALHEVDMGYPIPPGLIGVIVRGDSMFPIFEDGDLVAYRGEELTPEQAIGQEACVVQLADGRILIKKVRMGSQPGLFTLSSSNAPDIEDVPLEWAREFVLRFSRNFWRKG